MDLFTFACNFTSWNDTNYTDDLSQNETCSCRFIHWDDSCRIRPGDYTFYVDNTSFCCNCNSRTQRSGPSDTVDESIEGWELISLCISVVITIILIVLSWIVCRSKLSSLRSQSFLDNYNVSTANNPMQPLLDDQDKVNPHPVEFKSF